MRSFEEYWNEHGDVYGMEIAENAWDYQQSKVDELNQELHLVLNNWNDLTNAIHARTNGTAVAEARQLYEKVDELQKRVDAVKQLIQKYKDEDRELKLIDEWEKSQIYGLVASELEQALNGGGE